jgi:hypothetical protein
VAHDRLDLPVREVVTRYRRGESLKQLASRYGVAVGTIQKRLDEAGVRARPRGAPRREINHNELVYFQYLYGSTRRVADELAVGRSTVQRRLAELVDNPGVQAALRSSSSVQTNATPDRGKAQPSNDSETS